MPLPPAIKNILLKVCFFPSMYNYNLTQNDIASSFITELAIRAFKVDTVALLESLEVGRQFASIGKSYVLVGPIYFEKHVQNILPTLCCTF